jgi:hypothetical protein
MLRGVLLACVACGAAPGAVVATEPAGLTMTDTAVGPITVRTRANLVALRAALAGYEVQPVNVDVSKLGSLEYQVFDHGEKLFAVIPDEDGGILNVHVLSSKVMVAGHPWRVGEAFTGAAMLTTCECWGGKAVCFKKRAHVAVAFERDCRGIRDPRMRRQLEGQTIGRTVWSPTPFGVSEDGQGDDADGGDDDPCGGYDDPCGP